ncbi:MAG: DNA primase [Mycoplasmataceae bacterium]|nr:DNA primase [Mycoplasmataceae bacterium]
MQSINYKIVKEIIERADIVAVISGFIKLKKIGANYVGICPFHPDKNPSLTVNNKKKIWKCFVCGVGGNVIKFVEMYKKISNLEAIKIVGEMINYDFSEKESFFSGSQFDNKIKYLYDINKKANELYVGMLFDERNNDKLEYLIKRGLSKEIIKEFAIGYAPIQKDLIFNILTNKNSMFGQDYDKKLTWNEQQLKNAGIINIDELGGISDFMVDRITFPILDNDGMIVGFSGRTMSNMEPKYLNSKENEIFTKSKILYNFHNALNSNPNKLIIVEGFMDALAFYSIGCKNVVATMGTNLSDEHIKLIQSIPTLKTVILAFDNDNAGTIATINNGKKIIESEIDTYIIGKYDTKYKDVDELLRKEGKEMLGKIIDERRDYISFLIDNKFDIDKPIDEKISLIREILNTMLDINDILLKTTHLEYLSKKSGISLSGLNEKFDELLQERNKPLGIKKTITKQTNNSSEGVKKEEIDIEKDKINTICNTITQNLNNLILLGINDEQVVNLFKKIYFNELIRIFPVEVMILKIMMVLNNDEKKISEKNIYDLIKTTYGEEKYKIAGYLIEDIKNKELVNIDKNKRTDSANDSINEIEKKKYDLISTSISIQILQEENNENKDQNKIASLINKMKENTTQKINFEKNTKQIH